jgi:hypothetical protein
MSTHITLKRWAIVVMVLGGILVWTVLMLMQYDAVGQRLGY